MFENEEGGNLAQIENDPMEELADRPK